MARYAFQELTLAVEQKGLGENEVALAGLLHDLSWVRVAASRTPPSLRLQVRRACQAALVPAQAQALFRADEFCGFAKGDEFYLTDGASLVHLQAKQRQGTVFLAPSFAVKPLLVQANVWTFTLLKLLRPLGFYSLHAAGVVSPTGLGLLIIGPSGSGKTTLALGLIRQGWGYLSDDAVLLRLQVEEVASVAVRQQCYIDANAATLHVDLPLEEEAVPDTVGGRRRRVILEAAYPGRALMSCLPRVVVFSHIVSQTQSSLRPLDRVSALKRLLASSAPQLFESATMVQQLDVLKRLLQQTAVYELHAGRDLLHDSMTLVRLLAEAEGGARWPAW